MPFAVGLQPGIVHVGVMAEGGITECLFSQIGDVPLVMVPQVYLVPKIWYLMLY